MCNIYSVILRGILGDLRVGLIPVTSDNLLGCVCDPNQSDTEITKYPTERQEDRSGPGCVFHPEQAQCFRPIVTDGYRIAGGHIQPIQPGQHLIRTVEPSNRRSAGVQSLAVGLLV